MKTSKIFAAFLFPWRSRLKPVFGSNLP